jgi:hypothetical protein
MKLKEGVKVLGMQPEIVLAIMICESIYAKYNIEMVITSITDSKHSTYSRHYQGFAFDLRTRNIPSKETEEKIMREIKTSLTKDFNVLNEGDHFHIGFKPTF